MGCLDLVEFGGIDVHVDDFGLRAEGRNLARRPVIKTSADGDQQIAFIEQEIGTARAVHAEHA